MSLETVTQLDQMLADRFPRRIRKKEKKEFLAAVEPLLSEWGYETERLTLSKWPQSHLLLTQCQTPEVIVMAHFDTPTLIPIYFQWLFKLVGHTRQILGLVLLFLIYHVPGILANWLPSLADGLLLIQDGLYLAFWLLMIPLFIPNPHNREDNTSGVIALLALAEEIGKRPHLRDRVQFVLLDNEEWGLVGSGVLKQRWDRQKHPYREARIINLDCVSRGELPLVVYNFEGDLAREIVPFLQDGFAEARPFDMKLMPLSDNYTFRKQGAVNISFVDRTVVPGGYYIPRIHSTRDQDFNPRPTALLVDRLLDFATDVAGQVPPIHRPEETNDHA